MDRLHVHDSVTSPLKPLLITDNFHLTSLQFTTDQSHWIVNEVGGITISTTDTAHGQRLTFNDERWTMNDLIDMDF